MERISRDRRRATTASIAAAFVVVLSPADTAAETCEEPFGSSPTCEPTSANDWSVGGSDPNEEGCNETCISNLEPAEYHDCVNTTNAMFCSGGSRTIAATSSSCGRWSLPPPWTVTCCCVGGAVGYCGLSPAGGPPCNEDIKDCDPDPTVDGDEEICGNGLDDNCDGEADEATCTDEIPCDGKDNDRDGVKDEGSTIAQCGSCTVDGMPFHLSSREMYSGPHELARIESGISSAHDLAFDVLYDSTIAKADFLDNNALFPRVVGIGFRHSYGDRLILRGENAPGDPEWIEWHSMTRVVRLYPVAPSSDDYQGEPGTNARAYHASSALWRLRDSDGTTYHFEQPPGTNGTTLHPYNNSTEEYHLRLFKITPLGAMDYSILVQHESTSLPQEYCDDIFVGQSACTQTRGLLARVGVEWRNGVSPRVGAALEFKYAPQHSQSVLTDIVAATDRGNPSPPDTSVMPRLALLSYRTAAPARMLRVIDGELCPSLPCSGAALWTKFEYVFGDIAPTWALQKVRTPVLEDINDAYALSTIESFTWEQVGTGATDYFVFEHRSPGLLTTAQDPPGGVNDPQGGSNAGWTRNEASEGWSFDDAKQVTLCSSGACNDVSDPVLREYQYDELQGLYVLGTSFVRNERGVDEHRKFTEEGLVEFYCEVVPSGAAASECVDIDEDGVLESNEVSGGTVRLARRNYYFGGANEKQLRLTAEWIGSSAAALPRFPDDLTDAISAFAVTTPPISDPCAVVDPVEAFGTGTSHFFDVVVLDRNSNGDAALNEAARSDLDPLQTGGVGDSAIVRVTRAAADPLTGGTSTRTCTILPRDGTLRVGVSAHERRRFDRPGTAFGEQAVSETRRVYEPLTATLPETRGKLKSVSMLANPASGTGEVILWNACTDTLDESFDTQGRLRCRELPMSLPGAPAQLPLRIESVDTPASGPTYAYGRLTTTTASTNSAPLLQTTQNETGLGLVLQTKLVGGNYNERRYEDGDLPPHLREAVSRRSDGTYFADVTFLRDWLWSLPAPDFINIIDVGGGVGGATTQHRNVLSADKHGWPLTVEDNITSSTVATTHYTYTQWGDVATRTDPDNVDYTFRYEDAVSGGDPLNGKGRLAEVEIEGTTVRHNTYTRRGELKQVRHTDSGAFATEYAYDGLGQLVSEKIHTAGIERRYQYDEVGRIRVIDTGPVNFTTNGARRVLLLHDGLGRLLMRCKATNMTDEICASGGEQDFVYDTRALTGSWVVNGYTINLTNENLSGRLSHYTYPLRDAAGALSRGATFFEYDALGRVKAVVTHDAPFTGTITGSLLREVAYTYDPTHGALTEVQYPSGRRVKYLYGVDKERPSGVQVESTAGVFVDLIQSAEYEPSGAPKKWIWGTNASNTHEVSRDLLGRITLIEDKFGGVTKSKIEYPSYQADGDLSSETDHTAPTMHSSSPSSAPITRNYTYDSNRDWLVNWTGDTQSAPPRSFSSDGRPFSDATALAVAPPPPTVPLNYVYYNPPLTELIGARLNQQGEPAHGQINVAYWNVDGTTDGELNALVRSYNPTLTITHGFLGEVQSVNAGSGVIANDYDALMRRLKKSGPTPTTQFTTWRYGVDDRPLEEFQSTSATAWKRTETIYLAGQPIAFVVNANSGSQTIPYAITDRMGVVRKTRSSTLSYNRLVMAASGSGSVTADTANLTPNLGWRYPGQYQDSETGLINNRWRTLIPEIGMYTSPEPLHAVTSYSFDGAQSYRYASGNPMRYVDPNGLQAADAMALWGRSVALGRGDLSREQVDGMQMADQGAPLFGLSLFTAYLGPSIWATAEAAYTAASIWAYFRVATALGGLLAATGNACQGACSCAAQQGPKYRDFAPGQLQNHFNKHAGEWGTATESAYANRASDLLNRPLGQDLLEMTRKNGDLLRYNPRTNEFAVGAADGTIRTLFRPERGFDYWINEVTKIFP